VTDVAEYENKERGHKTFDHSANKEIDACCERGGGKPGLLRQTRREKRGDLIKTRGEGTVITTAQATKKVKTSPTSTMGRGSDERNENTDRP